MREYTFDALADQIVSEEHVAEKVHQMRAVSTVAVSPESLKNAIPGTPA